METRQKITHCYYDNCKRGLGVIPRGRGKAEWEISILGHHQRCGHTVAEESVVHFFVT